MRFLRETLSSGLLLAVVFVLVALPVLFTVDAALHADAAAGLSAARSLAALIDVLTGRDYLLALRNALALAGEATLLSLAIGVLLALILGRTDICRRATWEKLVVLPVFLAPFTGLMAWIALATPGTGFINRIVAALAGLLGGAPVFALDIWSYAGAVLVMTMCFSPLVYLLTASSLRAADPALEDAALIGGASQLRTIWRITLPMCRPAILASGLLVFSLSVEIYTIPGLVGSNAGFATLPWRIFEDATAEHPQLAHAAAAATLLLAVVLIAALLQRRLARRGRVGPSSAASLSGDRWNWAAGAMRRLPCCRSTRSAPSCCQALPCCSPR